MSKPIINPEAYKIELGPTLLLAGPGTGKTWQLAKRIQYLTSEKEVPAEEITVITFTAEAANSMRRKIEEEGKDEYVSADKRPGRISTMHSLGFSILKEHPELVGLRPDFNVVENQQLREILMRDAALILGYDLNQAKLAMKERTEASLSEVSGEIIGAYEKILRLSNAIDYDDQIALACKILRENDDLRQAYVRSTKYLLVDEYQDINQYQFEFIDLLSQENRSGLFVVGDDDQSIYGFRGGSPQFIRNFQKHFGKNSIVCQMDISRRCLKNILDSAVSVVATYDESRLDKVDYKYTSDDEGKVKTHSCPSDDKEAQIIAAIISQEIKNAKQDKRKAAEFFVLVPTRLYSAKIVQTLSNWKIGVDYQVVKEDPGFQKVNSFKEWYQDPESSLNTRVIVEIIANSGSVDIPGLRAKSELDIRKRLDGLKQIAEIWKTVKSEKISYLKALKKLSKNDPLYKDIYSKLEEVSKLSKGKDVAQFLQKIALYLRPWSSPLSFLEGTSKLLSVNKKATQKSNNNVRILTFQSAKGLEADIVFIIGLEDGTVPRESANDVAEESRLFFVAMTRAKKQLHLFHCRKRTGAVTFRKESHSLKKSCFLDCLSGDKILSVFHRPKTKRKG